MNRMTMQFSVSRNRCESIPGILADFCVDIANSCTTSHRYAASVNSQQNEGVVDHRNQQLHVVLHKLGDGDAVLRCTVCETGSLSAL